MFGVYLLERVSGYRSRHSWDLLNVPFSFVQNGYGCGQNPTLDLIEAFEYKDGSDGTLKLKDTSGNYIKYDSPWIYLRTRTHVFGRLSIYRWMNVGRDRRDSSGYLRCL